MQRVICGLGSLFALVLGFLPLAGPAQAEGTGMPVLVRPLDGSAVRKGANLLWLDTSDALRTAYYVEIVCENGTFEWDFDLTGTTSEGISHYWSSAFDGHCDVTLTRPSDGEVATWDFTVVRNLITSPKNFAALPQGWQGSIGLDLSHAPAGGYTADLRCSAGSQLWTIDKTEGMTTLELPVGGYIGGRCTVYLLWSGDQRILDAVDFNVGLPYPWLGLEPGQTAFYPLVKDGYQDYLEVRYSVRRPVEAAQLKVLDSSYRTVRTAWIGTIPDDSTRRWRWDGRLADGRMAPTGKYFVQFVVTADGTSDARTTEAVSVATKQVWERGSLVKTGYQGAPTRSGACSSQRVDGRVTRMRCWGDGVARVAYDFSLPASTRDLSFVVGRAWSNFPGACCDGRLRTWGVRKSTTAYRVGAETRSRRAIDVTGVRVSYSYLRTY